MEQRMEFVDALDYSLKHIRGLFSSYVIHHSLSIGLFEALREPANAQELSEDLAVQPEELHGVLDFLAREDLIARSGDTFQITLKGEAVRTCTGWFIELVGGYADVVRKLDEVLKLGFQAASRDSFRVALGSGMIDFYDVIPLVHRLLREASIRPRDILDLGCGTGTCLASLCQAFPQAKGLGLDPIGRTIGEADAMARSQGVDNRMSFAQADAYTWVMQQSLATRPETDLVVMAFLLHEIYFQRGRDGLTEFLAKLRDLWPRAQFVVIEVDLTDDPKILQGPVGDYYHVYYLLHRLTPQRLQPREFWEQLFKAVGFRIRAVGHPATDVDPTGLELGFLLESGSSR